MARTEIAAEASLDTTKFQRGLAKADKGVKKFAKSAVARFGALAGAAGLGSMARAAVDLGSKISDLAVQLNVGTDQLQTLEFASREAGVGTEIMARALRNVQLRTEEALKGNKSYADAFKQLGINIQEFKALNTEKKLEAIAIAQRDAADQGAAYNSVARILGEKAGPALQEVLQNLAGPDGYGGLEAAAKRAGEVMSKETIAKMDKAADTIESWKRKTVVATATVLSAFQTFSERVGQGAAMLAGYEDGMDDIFEDMPDSINKATEAQNKFTEAIDETTESVESLSDQIARYFNQIKEKQSEERSAFLKEKELKLLELQANGEDEAAKALEHKIESMKKAIAIADKYGISLQKAADLVRKINQQGDTTTGDGGTTTGGASTFEGQTLEQAMADAKKQGIRFQRMRGPQGSEYYQRFENGRKAGRLTKEQLEKAAARRPQQKDPAQLAEQSNKYLESIDREIRRNP